ncbi:rRNA pseudouridine synthase [bacterium]|nr:rRNA pseudouridine synthase [bacterium]
MSSKSNKKKSTKDQDQVRLNKFLSQKGVLSRRQVDQYIETGRIKVAGKTIKELGFKVSPDEKDIEIDHVPLDLDAHKLKYYMFYKPKNVVSTLSDPEKRPCLGDFIQELSDIKLVPAGRLDYDAEGLVLLSNDGEFVHQMMHPRFGKKKTYQVKVKGVPTPEDMKKLSNGVKLEDGMAKAYGIKFLKKTKSNSWYEMALKEGRNHQIKRMWLKLGFHVLKILRIQFSIFKLGKLKPGQFQEIPYATAQTLLKK